MHIRTRLSVAVVVTALAQSTPGSGKVRTPAAAPDARTASIETVVPAGADLQAYIDRARPGDVLLLEPKAAFVGNFTLPALPAQPAGIAAQYITIRSAADPSHFPTGRVRPEDAQWMPTLRSPNGSSVLVTRPGAHHWRLQWLVFEANSGGNGNIISLGDGGDAQRDLATVPHHFELDGLIIRGDPSRGQKRGIGLNSGAAVIRNSDIRDIKSEGQDSQAICGWNGPGPYTIENNYLEAAGENVMFGGSDPAIRDLVPTDITIRRNHMSKPLEWRERGSRWTVKNLLELKSARRVLIEANLFENNWVAAQSGYAILIKPVNQDGGAPWAEVSDVTFQYNIVRHVSSAISINGNDTQHPSRQLKRLQIRHNLFYDVDAAKWGGEGRFLKIGDAPADLVIDHNTAIQSGSVVQLYGSKNGRPWVIDNFHMTNNLTLHNQYGIIGDSAGVGKSAIAAYLSREEIRRNVLAGGDASRYPADNLFPSVQELMAEFVDSAQGDYRLKADSRFRSAGTEGSTLGANIETIKRRVPQDRPEPPRRLRDMLPPPGQ
jgi:hypothetical protein